jgi:hypothetical protein
MIIRSWLNTLGSLLSTDAKDDNGVCGGVGGDVSFSLSELKVPSA